MKVLIVHTHALLGQSLEAMLQGLSSDGQLETRVCAGDGAPAIARQWGADVVLVEAAGDFRQGIDRARELHNAAPMIPVVMLGSSDDLVAMYESVTAGANGYLARDCSPDSLLATLTNVSQGELGLPAHTATQIVAHMRDALSARARQTPRDVESKLTQRETEILELVRVGMRSREVSERLSISEATVYKHIQNILDKLNVHSRTQAVLLAQNGIHNVPELAPPPITTSPGAPAEPETTQPPKPAGNMDVRPPRAKAAQSS